MITFFDMYSYITMHANMHGDIMYHLSDITMYIHIHNDKTILSYFLHAYLYTLQFQIPDQENPGDSLFASVLKQLANVPEGYPVKRFH